MKKPSLLACCLTLCAAVAWAQPQVVVNFSYETPFASGLGLYHGPGVLGSGTYWNAIYQAYGASGTFTNLTSWADDGATPTGISLSVDTDWSWGTGGTIPLFAQYAFTKSGPKSFAFSGIPKEVYDLVLFGVNGEYHAAGTIFTVNGLARSTTNTTDQAFVVNDNYVRFPRINVTDGTLSGTYEANGEVAGNNEGNFNGAQLVLVEGLVVYPPAAFPTNTVYGGTPVTLRIVAGAAPMQYQWRKGGVALPGSTTNSLVLSDPAVSDSGSYTVTVSNAAGVATSPPLTLTVLPAVAPFFTTQPASAARFLHQNITFRGVAEGSQPISLQWQHNGSNLPGATNATLAITDIKNSDLGSYTLVASNRVGSTPSTTVMLSLLTAPMQFTVNFDFDSYGTQWGSATPGTYHGAGVLGSGTFWNSIPQPDNGSGSFSSTNSLTDDGTAETGVLLSVGTDYSWGGGPTNSFTPGAVWLDTAGQPINAHGGGMLYHGRAYYWYGEDKTGRTWMPEVNRKWDGYRVDVTGIRCYSSKDLLRWKNEGLVLCGTPEDSASDLHPSKVVERPKVAYNRKTRKFVMWLHVDTADYETARAGVAVADSPTGPFRYLGSVKPEGGDSRDQTLFVDEDGRAYRIYASEWNKALYLSLLSDDWLSHSGKFIKLFPGQSLEAPILFKRAGKYYLFTSGCTGWDPNPAHLAVADSLWGPWQELGDPCRGSEANTTFQSQGTCIFQVASRNDAYVFMADRWNKQDLPDSRYVWLPIRFGEQGPCLEWFDHWDLSVFGSSQRPTRRPSKKVTSTSANPPFSIAVENGTNWLVQPDGKRFFSLGVCQVDMGTAREQCNPTNPAYAAWQHYAGSNQWARSTLKRLKSWGFTTLGGWGDFRTLTANSAHKLVLTPVLHMGATAGAPWWDMWDPKVIGRMDQVARDQILPLRKDPRLLGYYSDNEMGWWNAALLHMTLEQAPASGQRQRLLALLRQSYQNDWEALLKDFEAEKAADWKELEVGGQLYLRPGGEGLRVVRQFLGLMAERYYSLVREIIRKYDQRALILGERYQSFYFPEVARACSRYVDAVSSNLNASWADGSFPRFYLETLHELTGRPVLVSEFYMAARQNRSGNRNRSAVFPVTETQADRAAGFATTLRTLLGLPFVIGADWFQYYDEPPWGRYDGEDYNFGLVDIHDRPYEALTQAAARLDLIELKRRGPPPRADHASDVPLAPDAPLALGQAGELFRHWNRAGGWVRPVSEFPIAELYLCWSPEAVYVGLYAQDVVEPAFYRDKLVPECDRAAWTITLPALTRPLRFRIGAGVKAVASEAGLRLVNVSGVNWNVRDWAAVELPAELFGRERLQAGESIELTSGLLTHAQGYRAEWHGYFQLSNKK